MKQILKTDGIDITNLKNMECQTKNPPISYVIKKASKGSCRQKHEAGKIYDLHRLQDYQEAMNQINNTKTCSDCKQPLTFGNSIWGCCLKNDCTSYLIRVYINRPILGK